MPSAKCRGREGRARRGSKASALPTLCLPRTCPFCPLNDSRAVPLNLEQARRNPPGAGRFPAKGEKPIATLQCQETYLVARENRNLRQVLKVSGQACKSREGEGVTQRAAEEKSPRFAFCSGKQEQLRVSPPAPKKKAEQGHQERQSSSHPGQGLRAFSRRSAPGGQTFPSHGPRHGAARPSAPLRGRGGPWRRSRRQM